MFNVISLAAKPWFIYVKIGVIVATLAAVAAGVGWATWAVRSAIAQREKLEAVSDAIDSIQVRLDEEHKLRLFYQSLSDEKLEKLLQSIANIKIEHRTITNNITREVESNPEFYKQPLPEGGYEQWKRARALVASPAASSPR